MKKTCNEAMLRGFSNAVKSLATINFTLQEPGNTTLQLIDGLCRKVQTHQLGELAYGKHEFAFETSGLPKGLFVCALMVDDEVIGRGKVVVEK